MLKTTKQRKEVEKRYVNKTLSINNKEQSAQRRNVKDAVPSSHKEMNHLREVEHIVIVFDRHW